mgnify:CR=1 FL=1
MKIIVDMMGGDNAPLAVLEGAAAAVKEYGVQLIGVGDEALVRKTAADNNISLDGIELVNCTEVIEMCDEPARAIRTKKDSSIVVGLNMLKEGKGDAFVSAGSTGALLTGATLIVKRIRGIRRAAMAPVIPTTTGQAVLIDCGANAECTPEYLVQFAYLGSYYAHRVLGVERPRVGLLNIGTEDSKGTDLQKETLRWLREAHTAGHLNFIGNIEAKEAMLGECDVIVADGYSGNIMLKSIEGTGKLLSIKLKDMLMHSTGTKLAALLLKGQLGDFKKMLDANEVGGTALLGISKPVVKAHGSASEVGICNAVRQAMEVARSGIIDDIAQNIDKMRIEQKAE